MRKSLNPRILDTL